ncbi:hypothetical protein ABEB36_000766 [Hypothenemus hampei]|uniref:FLYWCH-type domain-containing protein n=1 Tax=Hypothenemus hampei TaxID=57062 RepID=A0ABD1FCF8_HYPHA
MASAENPDYLKDFVCRVKGNLKRCIRVNGFTHYLVYSSETAKEWLCIEKCNCMILSNAENIYETTLGTHEHRKSPADDFFITSLSKIESEEILTYPIEDQRHIKYHVVNKLLKKCKYKALRKNVLALNLASSCINKFKHLDKDKMMDVWTLQDATLKKLKAFEMWLYAKEMVDRIKYEIRTFWLGYKKKKNDLLKRENYFILVM